MFIYIAITIISFVGMEVFSWAFHKYIMHGVLWNIHQTHHQHHKIQQNGSKNHFELNDIFSVIFGSISIFFIIFGLEVIFWTFFIGLGIVLYGFVYFILHDGFIHQRFPFIRNSNNKFIIAIRKAHFAHHKTHERDGSESFGLLFINKKFFQ
jgi:beta-carotene 3-hydroxylase